MRLGIIRKSVTTDRLQLCLITVAVLLSSVFAFQIALDWYKGKLSEDQHAEVHTTLVPLSSSIAAEFNHRFALLEAVEVCLESEPPLPGGAVRFADLASALRSRRSGIRSIQALTAAGSVLMSPLRQDQTPEGWSDRGVLSQRLSREDRETAEAVLTDRLVAGPPSRGPSGERIVLGRLPVFVEGDLWGIVAMAVDVSTVLSASGMETAAPDLAMIVRDDSGAVVWGEASIAEQSPVSCSFSVANRPWSIAAVPAGGWERNLAAAVRPVRGLGYLLVVLLTAFAYVIASRQADLAVRVRSQTRKIADSETRYHALFDENADALFLLEEDGTILEWNKTAVREYGLPSADGEFRADFPSLSPVEMSGQVLEEVQNAAESRNSFLWIHRDRDGGAFPVEVKGRFLDLEGRRRVLVTVHDLARRAAAEMAIRRSEQRLARSQMVSKVGSIECDLQRGEVEWSEQTFCIFGVASQGPTPTLEETMELLFPGEKLFRDPKAFRRWLEPAKFETDLEITTQDTRENKRLRVWWEVTFDGTRQPRVLSGVIQDVTEQKHLEAELVRAQRLMAVGELAAGVSHNLNNVLTNILGPAQLLQQSSTDATVQEEVSDIIASTLRARDLVRDLHRSVRPSSEGLRPLEIDPVIREVIQTSQPRWKDEAQARGQVVEIVLSLGLSRRVLGDGSRFHSVITNLLFNSLDAMPQGGRIEIRSYDEGEFAVIKFADNGVGMDESTRLRVFEPFFTTKSDLGTGLGLATLHNTVESWGGTVSLESALGLGTTVTVRLPFCSKTRVKSDRPSLAAEQASGNLLIVDDDIKVCRFLSRFLGKEHHVEVAQDCATALELFRSGTFEVALIDLGMPDMSGDQLLDELRKRDPDLVAIMISGWQLDEEDPRSLLFDFILQKPLGTLEEIRSLVYRAIEKHRGRAAASGWGERGFRRRGRKRVAAPPSFDSAGHAVVASNTCSGVSWSTTPPGSRPVCSLDAGVAGALSTVTRLSSSS